MKNYLDIMQDILANGAVKGDRTGTGTRSVFGRSMEFDLTDGQIPLLSTKQIFHEKFTHETIWFVSGSTDIKYLKDNNVSIWDSWVIPETAIYGEAGFNKARKLISGSIGKAAYGALWRKWEDTRIVSMEDSSKYVKRGYDVIGTASKNKDLDGDFIIHRTIDQLKNAIELIKNNPDSRRIIVSAWNPGTLEDAALPPCHTLFQFWTREKTTEEKVKAIADAGLTQALASDYYHIASMFQNPFDETPKKKPHLHEYIDTFMQDRKLPTRFLSTLLYCRSQDFPVGTPFNIAQYGLLTQMVAHVTGTDAERLFWVGGDVHAYTDQVELVREQLQREPKKNKVCVKFNGNVGDIDQFTFENITIKGYENFHPSIKYPVSV